MTIVKVSKTKTILEYVELEQDLLWYDSETKKLLKFCGGKLSMKWREESPDEMVSDTPERRWLPVVESVTVKKFRKISKEESFDVPDDEVENFTEELENNNFKYEIM